MKISFVLPGSGHAPVGGFKVVYEYANALVRRGHEVTVIHSARRRIDRSAAAALRSHVRYLRYFPRQRFRPDALARNIVRFTEDRELRLRLGQDGNAFVQQFTWDRATDAFEKVIRQRPAKRPAGADVHAAMK